MNDREAKDISPISQQTVYYFTEEEEKFCEEVTRQQLEADMKVGGKHPFDLDGYPTEQAHRDGLLAEWAVHKFLGIPFNPPINRDGRGDQGKDFLYRGVTGQVKHTLHEHGVLFFRKGKTDFLADFAVLVYMDRPDRGFHLLGWIEKPLFNKIASIDDFGKGKLPVRKVDQDRLAKMDDLLNTHFCTDRRHVGERSTLDLWMCYPKFVIQCDQCVKRKA